MKSLSLYDMTTEMLAILEAEEVSEEMMDAAFGDIVAKDSRICHFIRDVEAAAAAHKDEAKRIADRQKALENKAKALKSLIQQSMERLGMEDLHAGTFKLKIQNSPPALEIQDEEKIPAAYKVVVPATIAPDRERIKADLKAGLEVPGAVLTVGRSLRIR